MTDILSHLQKYFDPDELNEIKESIENHVNDRVSEGEILEDVLSMCTPTRILHCFLPELLDKRLNSTLKSCLYAHHRLFITFFKTPYYYPLGIFLSLLTVWINSLFFIIISLMIFAASSSVFFSIWLIPRFPEIHEKIAYIGLIVIMLCAVELMLYGLSRLLIKVNESVLRWMINHLHERCRKESLEDI